MKQTKNSTFRKPPLCHKVKGCLTFQPKIPDCFGMKYHQLKYSWKQETENSFLVITLNRIYYGCRHTYSAYIAMYIMAIVEVLAPLNIVLQLCLFL